jgi:hypothetical protein
VEVVLTLQEEQLPVQHAQQVSIRAVVEQVGAVHVVLAHIPQEQQQFVVLVQQVNIKMHRELLVVFHVV